MDFWEHVMDSSQVMYNYNELGCVYIMHWSGMDC